MFKKFKSDKGLMGSTHALSALALTLLLTWLANDFMINKLIGTTNSMVYITALIIIIGASLMPDFDAVVSTSINTLGIVGSVLSKVMRAISSIIQGTIKGPYDKSTDPHRGFWHTFISAGLVGLATSALASIQIELFKVGDKSISVATLVIMFTVYISIQLVLASFFKNFYKKSKKGAIGVLTIRIGSLIATTFFVASLPSELSYTWIGPLISFGWVLHLVGDMLTVAGVPVLAPLKFKGKRWWNFRFLLGIKAGGFFEKTVIIPSLSIIAFISFIKIIPMLT